MQWLQNSIKLSNSVGTILAAQFPALTGDVTTVEGSLTTTLATVNNTTGTFGSVSAIPVVTVNEKGLVTDVTTAALGTMATQNANAVNITGGNAVIINDTKAGQSPVAITVGASPFSYTMPYGGSVDISGGMVTHITRSRAGVTTWTSTLSSATIAGRAGDVVTVTYTTAPTMYQVTS
jgi:hypothetical protein